MNTISTDDLKAKIDRGERFHFVEVGGKEAWHAKGFPVDRPARAAS